MALVQAVENGQVVQTSSSSDTTSSSNTTYDSEMFINLLVAEMKYQDPLEPTSNTEWVSQYATFSQVEQVESMADSLTQMQSEDLVGKTVIMKSTSATGDTSYYSGQVSYVEKQSDGSYKLCVSGTSGEQMFDYDQIDSIVDTDYLDAITLADTFKAMIAALPSSSSGITSSSASAIKAARTAYESMTDYQKQFVSNDSLSTLTTLEKKLSEYEAQQKAAEEASEEEDTEETV